MSNKSKHEIFAERVIEQLKNNAAPWQKPWEAGEFQAPFNPVSKTNYRGINCLNLAGLDYADPRWMTFKQANDQNLKVQKGAKAEIVQFWKFQDRRLIRDENGQPVLNEQGEKTYSQTELERPLVAFAHVFHASQIKTQDGHDLPPFEKREITWNPNERVEAILKNTGITINNTQRNSAFYGGGDAETIHLPTKESFPDAGRYYSTALHELAHWTGHQDRLNRESFSNSAVFGSETYAREELRAEIASWMLTTELGLPHEPGNHAAYVKSWIKALEDDPNEIVKACRDAEQIKEMILGFEKEKYQKNETLTEPDVAIKTANKEPKMSSEDVYLTVPFKEKNQAKALGAKWDGQAKLWLAPAGLDLNPLIKWIPENVPIPAKGMSPEEEFKQALKEAGLVLDSPPLLDGKIHRVAALGGKPGAKDGAYCAYGDGHPNGWFKNHKTGEQGKWIATGQALSEGERAAMQKEAEERLAERAAEREAAYEKAAQKIKEHWHEAAEVKEHQYLNKKGVQAFGLKCEAGDLLIPGRDLKGKMKTMQRIDSDGRKSFAKGAQKKGACHVIDPQLQLSQANYKGEILMAEGYATGASLHMATGKPVVVAFDAGNILEVARNIKSNFAEAQLVICADNDNDIRLGSNIGLEKARLAASEVGGRVIAPLFSEEEKARGLTDFNDVHQARGLTGLKVAIEKDLAKEQKNDVPEKGRCLSR